MEKAKIFEYAKNFSEEDMAKITEDYDSGIALSTIIRKYGLEITTSQFGLFLPMITTGKKCVYCDKFMGIRRVRTQDRYLGTIYTCPKCGHKESERKKNICNCINCISKRERQIFLLYSSCIGDKVHFKSLNFETQINLFILFQLIKRRTEFDYISRKYVNERTYAYIGKLVKEKVIYVSPDSPPEAFPDDDDAFPYRYYCYDVNYIVNVAFDDEDKDMILSGKFRPEGSEEESRVFLKSLIVFDLYEQFERMLLERKIRLQPSAIQRDSFENIMDKVSYSQGRYLCYKTAVYYSDLVICGKLGRDNAGKRVMGAVKTFYYNSLEKFGDVYSSRIDDVGDKLKTFIEVGMGEKLDILYTKI